MQIKLQNYRSALKLCKWLSAKKCICSVTNNIVNANEKDMDHLLAEFFELDENKDIKIEYDQSNPKQIKAPSYSNTNATEYETLIQKLCAKYMILAITEIHNKKLSAQWFNLDLNEKKQFEDSHPYASKLWIFLNTNLWKRNIELRPEIVASRNDLIDLWSRLQKELEEPTIHEIEYLNDFYQEDYPEEFKIWQSNPNDGKSFKTWMRQSIYKWISKKRISDNRQVPSSDLIFNLITNKYISFNNGMEPDHKDMDKDYLYEDLWDYIKIEKPWADSGPNRISFEIQNINYFERYYLRYNYRIWSKSNQDRLDHERIRPDLTKLLMYKHLSNEDKLDQNFFGPEILKAYQLLDDVQINNIELNENYTNYEPFDDLYITYCLIINPSTYKFLKKNDYHKSRLKYFKKIENEWQKYKNTSLLKKMISDHPGILWFWWEMFKSIDTDEFEKKTKALSDASEKFNSMSTDQLRNILRDDSLSESDAKIIRSIILKKGGVK
jgi:hypothetical protein